MAKKKENCTFHHKPLDNRQHLAVNLKWPQELKFALFFSFFFSFSEAFLSSQFSRWTTETFCILPSRLLFPFMVEMLKGLFLLVLKSVFNSTTLLGYIWGFHTMSEKWATSKYSEQNHSELNSHEDLEVVFYTAGRFLTQPQTTKLPQSTWGAGGCHLGCLGEQLVGVKGLALLY